MKVLDANFITALVYVLLHLFPLSDNLEGPKIGLYVDPQDPTRNFSYLYKTPDNEYRMFGLDIAHIGIMTVNDVYRIQPLIQTDKRVKKLESHFTKTGELIIKNADTSITKLLYQNPQLNGFIKNGPVTFTALDEDVEQILKSVGLLVSLVRDNKVPSAKQLEYLGLDSTNLRDGQNKMLSRLLKVVGDNLSTKESELNKMIDILDVDISTRPHEHKFYSTLSKFPFEIEDATLLENFTRFKLILNLSSPPSARFQRALNVKVENETDARREIDHLGELIRLPFLKILNAKRAEIGTARDRWIDLRVSLEEKNTIWKKEEDATILNTIKLSGKQSRIVLRNDFLLESSAWALFGYIILPVEREDSSVIEKKHQRILRFIELDNIAFINGKPLDLYENEESHTQLDSGGAYIYLDNDENPVALMVVGYMYGEIFFNDRFSREEIFQKLRQMDVKGDLDRVME